VKCPKCGFVSHPDLAHCKRCGHVFGPAAGTASTALKNPALSTPPLPSQAKLTPSLSNEEPSFDELPESVANPDPAALKNLKPAAATNFGALPAEALPHPQSPSPLLHDELSGRVQKFRSRRARLRGGFDPSTTPDLEFDAEGEAPSSPEEIAALIGGQVVEFGERGQNLNVPADLLTQGASPMEAMPQSTDVASLRVLSGAAVEAGETPLGRLQIAPEPVEIVLDSAPADPQVSPLLANASIHPFDLMGRRFAAGLVDTAVLLAGLGIFAVIFWEAHPHTATISFRPENLVALGLISVFLMLFYFGTSVALTASTPGLAWVGLEIRNLNGEVPNAKESCWRAFGYLVSASALFLGFVWALLDSDGLTWHDLMSGTFIAEREKS